MIVPSRDFEKQCEKLDPGILERVMRKIAELEANLSVWRHERLKARPDCKLRAGDWRVIYQFDLNKKHIYLLDVGHRSQIYYR